MIEKRQIYKCATCNSVVEIVTAGNCNLVCCDQPMVLEAMKQTEEGFEKHLPVVVIDGHKVMIRIGSVPHPMTPEHHIDWVECIIGKNIYRKELESTDLPEVEFFIDEDLTNMLVREHCNIHGLWGVQL